MSVVTDHVLQIWQLYGLDKEGLPCGASLEVTAAGGEITVVDGKVYGSGYSVVPLRGEPPFSVAPKSGPGEVVVYTTTLARRERDCVGTAYEVEDISPLPTPELQTIDSLNEQEGRVRKAKWEWSQAEKIIDALSALPDRRNKACQDVLLVLLQDLPAEAVENALETLFDGYAKSLIDLGVQPPESPFSPRKAEQPANSSDEVKVLFQRSGSYSVYSDGHIRLGHETGRWDGRQWLFEGRTLGDVQG